VNMNDSLFGPGILGNLIIIAGIIATTAAFAGAIKMTFWPGEQNANHPKYTILREDY
jgi:hypothetical protein